MQTLTHKGEDLLRPNLPTAAGTPEAEAPAHVSPDQVRLGYRLFLDREAEEGVPEALAPRFATLGELRGYFLNLPEFRYKVAPKRTPALSGHEPAMEIEAVQTDEQLATLFAHIQATWQHLGETEPHWSVSTAKEFLKENIDENRARFYDSGAWDCERLFRSLARNGIDASPLKSCLEIGCGVGRVTGHLARRFESVIGYDISKAHLEIARAYFEGAGIGNVDLRHLTALDDLRRLPKVDVVFTTVVLQHNPPPIMAMMVDQLIRCLNPGGVAFFQIPTHYVGYRFALADYLATDGSAHVQMEMHVLPQREVFEIARRRGARPVEVLEDSYTGCRDGDLSSTFLIQKLVPEPRRPLHSEVLSLVRSRIAPKRKDEDEQ